MSNNYYNLSEQCKTIIESNNADDSMKIISNLKCNKTGKKIGKKTALKIFIVYSDNSVPYDKNQYKNNITNYQKKVKKNIKIAESYK